MNKVVSGNATAFGISLPLGSGEPLYARLLLVHVEGLSADTVNIQGSLDGTNWFNISGINTLDASAIADLVADGIYRFDVAGFEDGQLRIKKTGTSDTVSAWVSLVVG